MYRMEFPGRRLWPSHFAFYGTRTVFPILVALVCSVLIGLFATMPNIVRLLVAMIITAALLVAIVRRPGLAVTALFSVMPFVGLIRRLLIPLVGWSTADPLLMVGPAIGLLLIVPALIKRDAEPTPNHVYLPVILFVGYSLLQALNPAQGGLTGGLLGAGIGVVPFLWFFVGHRFGIGPLINALLTVVEVTGLIAALYGLYQTFYGLLPFEQQWVQLAGYSSLNVGGAVRAISTFASSAEYAQFTAVAAVVAFVRGIRRSWWHFLFLVVLLSALFLGSGRSTMVTTLVAFSVVIAVRAQHLRWMVLRFAVTVTVSVILGSALLASLGTRDFGRPSAFIDHQVQGLLNPFDDRYSTAGLHLSLFAAGIVDGIVHPLGHGIGTVTAAAAKVGLDSSGTEVDISNAFSGLGVVGGVLYLWIVFQAFSSMWKGYRHYRSEAFLTLGGILVATLGQWWNTGLYVVPPLIWLMIGFIGKPTPLSAPKPEGAAGH